MFNQQIGLILDQKGDLTIQPRGQLPIDRLLKGKTLAEAESVIPGLFSLCGEAHKSAVKLLSGDLVEHQAQHSLWVVQGEALREQLLSLLQWQSWCLLIDAREQLEAKKWLLSWFNQWKQSCQQALSEYLESTLVKGNNIQPQLARLQLAEKQKQLLKECQNWYQQQFSESFWSECLNKVQPFDFFEESSGLRRHVAQDAKSAVISGDGLESPQKSKSGDVQSLLHQWLVCYQDYSRFPVTDWPLAQIDQGLSCRFSYPVKLGNTKDKQIITNTLTQLRGNVEQVIQQLLENSFSEMESYFSLLETKVSINSELSCGERSGRVAQVMTARGPLLHFVTLDQNHQILNYKILAPTERNFAVDGVLQRWWQLLARQGKTRSRQQLEVLALLLDACVEVNIAEAEIAEVGAEEAGRE
ncbi:hypothetical protein [Oceanospirillum beijerinckii]|uniref:hypothetical protein n=1 Tax=Oceanospirillum beijerinckii TaxID=64976 RepID=UPI0003FDCE55|nr:hypothetical protein [Oceanospirillum beijerinckii]